MRVVQEIYEHYRIMPSLQLHQLRVAAVAKYVCDRSTKPIDTHALVTACLLHDMGNIIKSDLERFPEFVAEKGLAYWQGVKDEYVGTYGNDEHHATLAIAQEIGASEAALKVMRSIGFSNVEHILADPSFELKISEYGDVRTGPYGVLSMADRLGDWHERYTARLENKGVDHEALHARFVRSFTELEEQLVRYADFRPEDITDAAIAADVASLRDYQV